jgi:hypothetical protein
MYTVLLQSGRFLSRDVMLCALVDILFRRNLPHHSSGFTLLPWRWKRQVSLKRRQLSSRLHGVTYQKLVRSSNLTFYNFVCKKCYGVCTGALSFNKKTEISVVKSATDFIFSYIDRPISGLTYTSRLFSSAQRVFCLVCKGKVFPVLKHHAMAAVR